VSKCVLIAKHRRPLTDVIHVWPNSDRVKLVVL